MLQQFYTTGYYAFAVGAGLGWLALRVARGPYLLWFAKLPGTLAHELAHYLVAVATFSSPSPISLHLKRDANGWRLGSVAFLPGFWTAGLVALAPAWVLPLVIYGLWREAYVSGLVYNLAAGYLAMILAAAALPSRQDWSIAIRYPAGTLIIAAGAAFAFWAVLLGKS